MKQYFNIIIVTFLSVSIFGCAQFTTKEESYREKGEDNLIKERFIPVELFTGEKWDGKHELILKEVDTSACASLFVRGKERPCNNFYITGPFKTKTNDTKIEWAGSEVSYYKRTFSTMRMGKVESYFTINNSKDGLVRIYDKRKQWGARTYDGLGSKFPLGYWKQGEVRTYASRRPTSIEIIELDGPNHCLTFRWVIGNGEKENMDNNYTFCPDRGFSNISHNNTLEQVESKLQVTVNSGVIKGNIPTLDPQFGNVWTNIHQDHLKQAAIKIGDTLCILVKDGGITKLDTKLIYLESFDEVAVGEPLIYLNNRSNLSFALNQANFAAKYHVASGAQWSVLIKQCN